MYNTVLSAIWIRSWEDLRHERALECKRERGRNQANKEWATEEEKCAIPLTPLVFAFVSLILTSTHLQEWSSWASQKVTIDNGFDGRITININNNNKSHFISSQKRWSPPAWTVAVSLPPVTARRAASLMHHHHHHHHLPPPLLNSHLSPRPPPPPQEDVTVFEDAIMMAHGGHPHHHLTWVPPPLPFSPPQGYGRFCYFVCLAQAYSPTLTQSKVCFSSTFFAFKLVISQSWHSFHQHTYTLALTSFFTLAHTL